VTRSTGRGSGCTWAKPRYTLEQHEAMERELTTLRAALIVQLDDVVHHYPTAAHSALGYPVMVRLRMAVRKIDEALAEAKILKYHDYPKG
jgi:hypothetical protein